jgi:cyanophycinase
MARFFTHSLILSFAVLAGLVTASPGALAGGPTKLVLVGGGNRPAAAMKQFADWAGGPSAKVLIIGWSSAQPEVYFGTISADLRAQGVNDFIPSLTGPKSESAEDIAAFTKEFLATLDGATGVFFAGGDQLKHMKVISLPGIREALLAKFGAGFVFAGTSAGCAIMSDPMLTGVGAKMDRGLGLLPAGVLVDQHGRRVGREARDLEAMRENGISHGILIDEDNAFTLLGGKDVTIYGPTWVHVYTADSAGNIGTEVLHNFDRFEMAAWKAVPHCPLLFQP